LPAALRYQTELASAAAAAKAVGIAADLKLTTKVAGLIADLEKSIDALETTLAGTHDAGDSLKEAQYFADKVIPSMNKVREISDTLETLVADDLWPLPTYQEMLFIR
jgi:glutamine synthetase